MDTYPVLPADVFLALSHLFLTQPYETRVIILICRWGIWSLTRLNNLLTAAVGEPGFEATVQILSFVACFLLFVETEGVGLFVRPSLWTSFCQKLSPKNLKPFIWAHVSLLQGLLEPRTQHIQNLSPASPYSAIPNHSYHRPVPFIFATNCLPPWVTLKSSLHSAPNIPQFLSTFLLNGCQICPSSRLTVKRIISHLKHVAAAPDLVYLRSVFALWSSSMVHKVIVIHKKKSHLPLSTTLKMEAP